MSIIHDALKKAEEAKTEKINVENLVSSSVSSSDKNSKRKAPSPKVIVVVALIFMVCVAFAFFGQKVAKSVLPIIQSFSKPKPVLEQQIVIVPELDPAQKLEAELKIKEIEAQKKKDSVQKMADEFVSLYDNGSFEEAVKVMEELVKEIPTDPILYNNMGLVYKRAGNTSKALEAYSKALALNPDYPEALNNIGTVYLAKHDYVQAKDSFLKALNLRPDYLDACLHLAIAYEKNDELEKAKLHYREFLKKSEGKVDKKIRLHIEERLVGLLEL